EAMSANADGPRELTITSAPAPTDVLVAVADTGPGLPPASRERMFQAFYTTKSRGMGMGLAISRSILDAHGGGLWPIDHEPGGAGFTLSLPIATDPAST